MKLTMQIIAALIVVAVMTGCNTVPIDMNAGYATLINQERTYTSFEMKVEKGGSILLTGPVHIRSEAPLEPIKAIPQSPDTLGKVVDAFTGITRTGLTVWGGVETVKHLSKRPQVIESTVVRPEVVFIPAGV